MKTSRHLSGQSAPRSRNRAGQRGSAVIVVLALLGIMLLYVESNLATLNHLHRELRLVELRQLRHWQAAAPSATNTPPRAPIPDTKKPGTTAP